MATGLIDKVAVSKLRHNRGVGSDDRLPLAELLVKSGGDDFLPALAGSVLQIIMEADVDRLIGAGRP